MKNEKKAFLGPMISLLGSLGGGVMGANYARRALAPKLYSAGRQALKKKPKTLLGQANRRVVGFVGKKHNANNVADTLGMISGGTIGGLAGLPFTPAEESADMQKYSEAHLRGFMKAAEVAKLSEATTANLLKRAFGNYDLRPEDVARIRLALQDRGISAPYDDPYGALNARYNQQILRSRDQSLDQIPEVEGAAAAGKKGLTGGAMGGIGGYALGTLLRSPEALGSKVPYGFKKNLPAGLGTGGAILGSLLGALPAYKQKVDEVKGLQKLNYPENMHKLISNIEADKALLTT